jgi:hypothetical protein
MFAADFLYVNDVFKISVLLIVLLMKDKYLTSRLTFSRFLTLSYGSRKKTVPQNKTE